MRFHGPVLTRVEEDYHVMTLPDWILVHLGQPESVDWKAILDTARKDVEGLTLKSCLLQQGQIVVNPLFAGGN